MEELQNTIDIGTDSVNCLVTGTSDLGKRSWQAHELDGLRLLTAPGSQRSGVNVHIDGVACAITGHIETAGSGPRIRADEEPPRCDSVLVRDGRTEPSGLALIPRWQEIVQVAGGTGVGGNECERVGADLAALDIHKPGVLGCGR